MTDPRRQAEHAVVRAHRAQVDLVKLAAANRPAFARLGTRQVVARLDSVALVKLAEYQTGLIAALLQQLRGVAGNEATDALVAQLTSTSDEEFENYASNPAITAKRD